MQNCKENILKICELQTGTPVSILIFVYYVQILIILLSFHRFSYIVWYWLNLYQQPQIYMKLLVSIIT